MTAKTIRATYDGSTFNIPKTVDLEPGKDYLITIEEVEEAPTDKPLAFLLQHAGEITGPGDGSVEHDHYLYGTPKMRAKNE